MYQYLIRTSAGNFDATRIVTKYSFGSFVELQPYGIYEILLSACTDVGCTNSTTVTARTLQAKPQGKLHNMTLGSP